MEALSTPVILAILVVIGVVAYMFYFRKNAEVRKEAQRLKAKERSEFSSWLTVFPWAIILGAFLFLVIIIQSLGYIVSQYFGFNWIGLGFMIKGVIVFLLVYLVFSIMTHKFIVDNPARMILLLILMGLLVAGLFLLEELIPQLFSTTNLYSVSQIFG